MVCNEFYQYSLALSLMDGVADKGLPISEYLKHGDHGIGTFRYVNGELIVLDGKAYQMLSNGSVLEMDPEGDAIHPFAQATYFKPETKAKVVIPSKESLGDLVSDLIPGSKNHCLAIRVDGVFKSVTVRTAGGQTEPRQSLMDIGKNQASFTFENERGTLIGFRQPHYMQGIGIAADHLHFITEDRQRGGHVLALLSDGEADVQASQMFTMKLELPKGDEEFNEAPLLGSHKELEAVEG